MSEEKSYDEMTPEEKVEYEEKLKQEAEAESQKLLEYKGGTVQPYTKVQPITIITGIKYNKQLLRLYNNVTFLYDPNWEYASDTPTYPIAFFFVKNMTESMTSDISQKPLLFYNSGADGTDSTAGGLMNIVADNIITKPKEYKLDLLVPANNTTFKNTTFSIDERSTTEAFIFSQGNITSNNVMSIVNRIVGGTTHIVDTLFNALYGTELNASSTLNKLLAQKDYNKSSLEYMWKNRRIVKMKLWNGWNFKYLVIKSLDVSKVGEDGDYYTANLVCQEIPIMTFRSQAQSKKLSTVGYASSVLGKGMKLATETFINGMQATLDV